MQSNKIIVIVGPTASGKSDLAVRYALRLRSGQPPQEAEIISADSRQVYKGLDIGSGKITKKEMRGVRHHLLDVASPRRTFTVAQYQKLARKALKDILRRGKTAIIVGGTGFYIDALLNDTSLPEVKPNAKLRAKLGKLSAPELFKMLLEKDPVRAASIDRHNPRRLIRALEIIAATGKPVPSFKSTPNKNVLKIGIALPPEELKKRIHARLKTRMKQGMVAEVKRLHAEGLSSRRLDDLGLEYRYVSRYLRGLLTKEEMLAELEKEIWHYARRQMTWWRKDEDIKWTRSLR